MYCKISAKVLVYKLCHTKTSIFCSSSHKPDLRTSLTITSVKSTIFVQICTKTLNGISTSGSFAPNSSKEQSQVRFSPLGPPQSTTQKIQFCQSADTPDFRFGCVKTSLWKSYQFQAKISNHSCVQRVTLTDSSSKDKRRKDISHSMSRELDARKFIFQSQQGLRFDI